MRRNKTPKSECVDLLPVFEGLKTLFEGTKVSAQGGVDEMIDKLQDFIDIWAVVLLCVMLGVVFCEK